MKYESKALSLLCTGEWIERFSYFGILTVLVLKLHQVFGMSDTQSFSIFGVFLSLSFGLLVISGYLSDRMIGSRHAILLGTAFLLLANLLLSSDHRPLFFIGLSCLITGTAFFKVNCTSLISAVCPNDASRRERHFTVFYSCMNFGSLVSPVFYGLLIARTGWSDCFYFTAGWFGLVGIWFFLSPTLRRLSENASIFIRTPKKTLTAYVIIVSLLLFTFSTFSWIRQSLPLLALMFVGCFALLIKLWYHQPDRQRKSFILFGILGLGCALFFACSFQVGSSMTLYIERELHRNLGGWIIPTPVFSALDPLFVVLSAPLLVWIWKRMAQRQQEPLAMTKIGIGLCMACFAFLCMAISAAVSSQAPHLAIVFVILANVGLGAGEIALAPAVLSAISTYTPPGLRNTMTGSWFLFVALGGFLSGQLSRVTAFHRLNEASLVYPHTLYLHGFLIIAAIALGMAVVVLFTRKIF